SDGPVVHRFVVSAPVSCLMQGGERVLDDTAALLREGPVDAPPPQGAVVGNGSEVPPEAEAKLGDHPAGGFGRAELGGAPARVGDVLGGPPGQVAARVEVPGRLLMYPGRPVREVTVHRVADNDLDVADGLP